MRILNKEEITAKFNPILAIKLVKEGFIAYSKKEVSVPPVQNFYFDQVNGDCCIKSAYIKSSKNFTVKISTGFYKNSQFGLPNNNGLLIVLSAETGLPIVLLQDEGMLTSIRTAIAGQLVAQVMAPTVVKGIGLIGTGDQARLQLEYLKLITECRDVHVWGPNLENRKIFKEDMSKQGFNIHLYESPELVARNSNLIVTTTPSRKEILKSEWINPGTHITAVGADSLGKQELDPMIIKRAGLLVVDSIEQCSKYGEFSHAIAQGLVSINDLTELGEILNLAQRARNDSDPDQISIADLTGIAVQDAQIASSIILD